MRQVEDLTTLYYIRGTQNNWGHILSVWSEPEEEELLSNSILVGSQTYIAFERN